MRNSWQEDGICTGGGNNSGRRHCQLLARRFRATLQAWATGWEIGWEQPGWETKQELQRGAFSGAYKGAKKTLFLEFPVLLWNSTGERWKKKTCTCEKKVPYLEFGGWHGYGSTGSRRPDASNPVVYHGEIIIFPMYRWRLWVMPKLPGAKLYSRPIVSPLWLVLWAPLMLRIYNVHCLKSLVLTLKSMFWPVESPSLTVNREFCGLNRYFHFWWLPWPFLPVLNSDFQPRRRDQCICQQHPFWLRLSMHQENCQRGRPWLISWSWVCYKIYKCDNKSIHISIRTKPYD